MAQLNQKSTFLDHQKFTKDVYGLNNDRNFTTSDMLTQMQRFCMRGLKGIRKKEKKKTILNLMITLSWFMSFMNQFHIDVQEAVWNRFPNLCSYCKNCPCVCRKEKRKTRKKTVVKKDMTSKNIAEFQKMFSDIYPSTTRTLEHAGIHLAEELGELAEAALTYRGSRDKKDFKKISEEGADFLSCLFAVCNSWEIDVAKELAYLFSENCHVCKKVPCECTFSFISSFDS